LKKKTHFDGNIFTIDDEMLFLCTREIFDFISKDVFQHQF